MPPAPCIDALRGLLEREPNLRLGYVFGSVARGEARADSDIDVAVLGAAPIGIEEQCRLSEVLGRGLGQGRVVEVVDLRRAPPLLLREVLHDGICVLEVDPLARFDFEMDAMRRFEDTRFLRRTQQQLLREGTRGAA